MELPQGAHVTMPLACSPIRVTTHRCFLSKSLVRVRLPNGDIVTQPFLPLGHFGLLSTYCGSYSSAPPCGGRAPCVDSNKLPTIKMSNQK